MSSDNLLDEVLDELECGFCVVRHFMKTPNAPDVYQIIYKELGYQEAQELCGVIHTLQYTDRPSCIYVAHESNLHVGICRS